MRISVIALVFSIAVSASASSALAEESLAAFVRANYTKSEHMVPMRDGVRLFTAVYVPNDLQGTWPVMLHRTPYGAGPYGPDRYPEALGPGERFARDRFIFVVQDVRGKRMSEGEFVDMRPQHPGRRGPGDVDESTDAYDTIEWIVRNVPRNNGRVGMWGISYPGFYAAAGAIGSHPALKAVSPQAPIADWWFDDMHHHGAFSIALAFGFLSSFGQPRPEPAEDPAPRFDFGTADGYRFYLDLGPLRNANERHLHGAVDFWNQFALHPTYDEFWQARNLLPHLRDVRAAMLVVGGWFDAEDLYGSLQTYAWANRHNPRGDVRLVMGPWSHGGWGRNDGRDLGTADFGFATSLWYREHVEFPFFAHHLKGAPDPGLPEALVFETGADRWRSFDEWPPAVRSQRLHLVGDGMLGDEAAPANGFAEFLSDPARPVPYTTAITTGWERTYMTEDQRFAERRPDVLTWRSEVLQEDVTIAGPITAELFVSTTAEDADWVVKLIDELPPVHPEAEKDASKRPLGGKLELVRGEILRGRFRNSYERPEPFVPGEVTRVDVPLQDVMHTFRKGHRIVVQVQSSWFPLFDRNPQGWVDNIWEAEEADFVRAWHRVHHGPQHPSALRVGILPESMPR